MVASSGQRSTSRSQSILHLHQCPDSVLPVAQERIWWNTSIQSGVPRSLSTILLKASAMIMMRPLGAFVSWKSLMRAMMFWCALHTTKHYWGMWPSILRQSTIGKPKDTATKYGGLFAAISKVEPIKGDEK